MKKHDIFETNPNLKEVHMTSDGQAFYNDNDAKLHAKTLENKEVELVVNPNEYQDLLEDPEDLTDTAEITDLGQKFIDSLKTIPQGEFKSDYLGSFLNSDDSQAEFVADFSDEKTDEGIKEPLTEIKAEADGSENILLEGHVVGFEVKDAEVLSEEDSQNVIEKLSADKSDEVVTQEKPAEEKKSNAKKGK